MGRVADNSTNCSKILLVDADRDFADLLAFLMTQAGLVPLTACDPLTALELLDKHRPRFVIADVRLPPWDGFELLAEFRRRSSALSIIVLTLEANEDQKVRALDIGADDYIVKPCGHRELVARVRAQARRAENGDHIDVPTIVEVGPLRLDPAERTLRIDGEVLRLSGTETRLLHFLMRNHDSVVSTAAVAKHVWGYDDVPAREVVRVTVHRLRRKIGDSSAQRRFIHTVPGIGLKLKVVEMTMHAGAVRL